MEKASQQVHHQVLSIPLRLSSKARQYFNAVQLAQSVEHDG